MTQQESEPDSTRQRHRVSFAPYIHKSLIIALCWLAMYIFTPVCTCIKVQGLVFKTFKFICVSCESLYWCHLSGEEKTHTDTHTSIPGFILFFLRGLSRGTVPLDPFYFPYKQHAAKVPYFATDVSYLAIVQCYVLLFAPLIYTAPFLNCYSITWTASN